MKITVMDHSEKTEPVMQLYLEQCPHGVMLCGTDSGGNSHNIAYIGDKGISLCLIASFSGWPLDERHRLKLVNY
jgi:hypothetical protein